MEADAAVRGPVCEPRSVSVSVNMCCPLAPPPTHTDCINNTRIDSQLGSSSAYTLHPHQVHLRTAERVRGQIHPVEQLRGFTAEILPLRPSFPLEERKTLCVSWFPLQKLKVAPHGSSFVAHAPQGGAPSAQVLLRGQLSYSEQQLLGVASRLEVSKSHWKEKERRCAVVETPP